MNTKTLYLLALTLCLTNTQLESMELQEFGKRTSLAKSLAALKGREGSLLVESEEMGDTDLKMLDEEDNSTEHLTGKKIEIEVAKRYITAASSKKFQEYLTSCHATEEEIAVLTSLIEDLQKNKSYNKDLLCLGLRQIDNVALGAAIMTTLIFQESHIPNLNTLITNYAKECGVTWEPSSILNSTLGISFAIMVINAIEHMIDIQQHKKAPYYQLARLKKILTDYKSQHFADLRSLMQFSHDGQELEALDSTPSLYLQVSKAIKALDGQTFKELTDALSKPEIASLITYKGKEDQPSLRNLVFAHKFNPSSLVFKKHFITSLLNIGLSLGFFFVGGSQLEYLDAPKTFCAHDNVNNSTDMLDEINQKAQPIKFFIYALMAIPVYFTLKCLNKVFWLNELQENQHVMLEMTHNELLEKLNDPEEVIWD